MDTFEIECFLSAVKYHNFTEAAENIFITQSSFSRRIMKLEKSLGVKLLVKCNFIAFLGNLFAKLLKPSLWGRCHEVTDEGLF